MQVMTRGTRKKKKKKTSLQLSINQPAKILIPDSDLPNFEIPHDLSQLAIQ